MITSESAVGTNPGRIQFDAEITAHLGALMTFAVRLTRVRADAEDLVSDTVLRALDRWDQYRYGTNMRHWLFTILFRRFVSLRRKHRMEVRLEEVGNDSPSHGTGSWSAPERSDYDWPIDERVTRALNELPGHYRLAIVLCDIRDLDYRQISRLLGIPVGTVKSRIYRGRRRLRTRLAAYAAEIGYTSVPVAA